MAHGIIREADSLSQDEITAWLRALRGRPFVEQSGFDVTAIFKVKAAGKTYYTAGVNVENPELIVGTCAEEGAIAAAVTAFGQQVDIVEGWVMGAPSGVETSTLEVYPCGECRQRIAQYTAPNAPVHIVTLEGKIANTQTREQLLPHAFSFRDLEHNAGDDTKMTAPSGEVMSRLFRKPPSALPQADILAWLQNLHADVRVSHYGEAVVAQLANGAYVAGVKVENAAYPSSTTAMQAAMAIMCGQFGRQDVVALWGMGRGENNGNAFYLPGGEDLQIARQFAQSDEVIIARFNAAGEVKESRLTELLSISPTFTHRHPA